MIEKLRSDVKFVTQMEPEKTENVSSPAQGQELVKVSNPAQEAKVTQTMKGDLALTGSLNMAVLGAQLSRPAVVGQLSPPVGSQPPEDISGPSTELPLELASSSEYQGLDPRIKQEVSSAYAALGKDPAGQKNLVSLVRDAKFAYLISPDAQSAAIAGLMQKASNPDHLKNTKELVLHAAILEKNANFNKLPEETKRTALNTMFYKPVNGGLETTNGRNAVTELVTDPNFGRLTPKQQDQFLEIVRANPDTATPFKLNNLMMQMDNMSQAVRAKAINVAHENAQNANMTGNWKQNDESFEALKSLLNDPAFIQATEEDQLAQLNGLSGRTGIIL